MTINTWEDANKIFCNAILLDFKKDESRLEGIEKFNTILNFIKKESMIEDVSHSNRIAKLHILLNKCIVYNALPTGDGLFNEYHGKCHEEVAKLNKLLLGKSYVASANFLLSSLEETYKKHSKYHNLTPKMLWAIGRLNFRLHNFDEAKLFLYGAAQRVGEKDRFAVYALLAYACEYSGHPSEAIEVLLGNNNPIFALPFCTKFGINKTPKHHGYCSHCRDTESNDCKNKDDEEYFGQLSQLFVSADKNIKKQIFNHIKNSSAKDLFNQYENYLDNNKFDKCENCELIKNGGVKSDDCQYKGMSSCRGAQNNELEEIIHILAHSISEYSSKILDDKADGKSIDPNNYRNFRIKMYLHNLANRLMAELGDYPFICCKAMLKAEAELVQEALKIINDETRIDLSKVSDTNEREGFIAERAFFRWYFSQLLNKEMVPDSNGKTPQNIFAEYADKVKSFDCDAQMHSILMQLRNCIRKFRLDEQYGRTNAHYQELATLYEKLLANSCSERVNREVRTEYSRFKCIAEILLNYESSVKDKISDKITNYAYPFLEVGKEKIESLKEFVEKSYKFKQYYFIFPVQYTGSLEYQMADIKGLIVDETEVYDSLKSEILNFDINVAELNAEFKKLVIKKDTEMKQDKIALILYYEAGQCFEFSERKEDKTFVSQKGFTMHSSIWNELVKDDCCCDELFHMFQYSKRPNVDYGKNIYSITPLCPVAIIITTDNTSLSKNTSRFGIGLEDEDVCSSQNDKGTSEPVKIRVSRV